MIIDNYVAIRIRSKLEIQIITRVDYVRISLLLIVYFYMFTS